MIRRRPWSDEEDRIVATNAGRFYGWAKHVAANIGRTPRAMVLRAQHLKQGEQND